MAIVWVSLVAILIAGVIWFLMIRPALEDLGWIQQRESVKSNEQPALDVMSRNESIPTVLPASSLQTGEVQTPDRQQEAAERRAKLLDTYKWLRGRGVDREEARAFLKPWGIPVDNNLWAKAALPPKPDDDEIVTPYAGRRTKRSYYPDDPSMEYQDVPA